MWQLEPSKRRIEIVTRGMRVAFSFVMIAMTSNMSASAQSTSRPAVVELFTSQGCSSCPAADALFEQYTKRPDVIALSYSVHYWDYLGWKDTLASPKFTDRQKAYAKGRGDGQVYTPQVVIGGHNHAVGSDKQAVEAAVRVSQKRDAAPSAVWLAVKLSRSAAGALVEVPASEAWPKDSDVWLAAVSRRVEVAVKRGENAGRTLTYFNAVRSFSQVGTYDGKALSLTIDNKLIEQSEADQIVVLVQYGMAGTIVGAAALAMK